MKKTININLSFDLPECFRFSIYQSCRKNDPEPYCVGLTREIGHRYQHETGFSSKSFEDAFGKAMDKFNTEQSKRYWDDYSNRE